MPQKRKSRNPKKLCNKISHLLYIAVDTRWGIGDGSIDWNKFFDALKTRGLKPGICLEVEAYGNHSKLKNKKRSIKYLKRMKFYPF